VASSLITLLCEPPAAGPPPTELELRGELPHWHVGHRLTPAGDGRFQADLRLGPGVYEYKLVAPGARWLGDRKNPRTRATFGRQNHVLVVGGCEEPVLHAPVAPWIEAGEQGGVIVRAALRKGGTAELHLRLDEGAGPRTAAMQLVASEDEHWLFETVVSGAGRFGEYHFVLADGRVVGGPGGAALAYARRDLAPPLPPWWREAVVYGVFLDRFRRGGEGGAWAEPERCDRDHHAGGDLAGVVEALPHLADLGVTVLQLTPITVAPSPHRYDVVDPFRVDPALGGEAGFDRLLAAADRFGMRVLLDVTVTHMHMTAAPFRESARLGPAAATWPWFSARRFPFHEGPDPGYEHYQKGQWQEPLLVTTDPGVAEHLQAVFEHWTRRGAAGFRIDAAADLPLELCARLRAAVQTISPDAVVYGEVVPAGIERWTASRALDAATDFAAHERLGAFLTGSAPAPALAAAAEIARFRRGSSGARRLCFSATHDHPRLVTRLADPRAARLGQVLVLLGAGVPLITYGDEIGLGAHAAAAARGRDFEDAWPDRRPMPWLPAAWDRETLAAVTEAVALRRRHAALGTGDERHTALADDVLLFRRRLGAQVIDVIAHRGTTTTTCGLLDTDAGAEAGAQVIFALGGAALSAADEVTLPPWSLLVVERTPGPGPEAALLENANGVLARRAFVEGLTVSPAYPRRLTLTVTEACNLRCVHCITQAPALTSEGRDRTVRPWLLDALAEAFAHAEVLSFTHGGESLTAPIFFDVLRHYAAMRRGAAGRSDVHLVTNGMLLDEGRARRLVEHGVTSIMVSIDGASAAVNDRIRVGGSLARVLANVRGLLALRARLGTDVRVGLSTVIGQAARPELDALAELAVALGVDWLKLEEVYPCTPFARRDFLPPETPGLGEAVERVRARLGQGGVVLVDHLAAPAACACSGDPRVVTFRAADDFANRAELAPCRMAWEQACIDPDGTVHAVDYAGPTLGRLGEHDFLRLWNAPAAQALRAQALAMRPWAARRRCAGDPGR
jgi:glycosidase/MoaA/NifB/PqqE/SkfB family radical SAM enzyme